MKKITSIFGAILAILLTLAIIKPVSAVEYNEIQISPSKSATFELNGGDIKTGSFNVNNIGANTFTFAVEVTPFTITDESYNPDYNLETNYTKLSKWITYTVDKTTLNPGESAIINYTITTPEDVPGGGQYAAITAAVASDGEGSVEITGRVAYIVYAQVNGETRLEGSVLENNIPAFLLGMPVSASSLVENTGNVDFDAEYNFEVLEAFKDEEVYSNTDEKVTYRILPETKRFINFTWDGSPLLGLFRVRQTVTVNGTASVSEKLVFLCPIWLLFIVVLGIIFIIIWLISRSRARRRQL